MKSVCLAVAIAISLNACVTTQAGGEKTTPTVSCHATNEAEIASLRDAGVIDRSNKSSD